MGFFTFLRRPRPTDQMMSPMQLAVRDALSNVQAYARSHGGEIELREVTEDGDVKIRLRGACNGCPLSDVTVKHGIEIQLKELVPGVRSVIQVP